MGAQAIARSQQAEREQQLPGPQHLEGHLDAGGDRVLDLEALVADDRAPAEPALAQAGEVTPRPFRKQAIRPLDLNDIGGEEFAQVRVGIVALQARQERVAFPEGSPGVALDICALQPYEGRIDFPTEGIYLCDLEGSGGLLCRYQLRWRSI